MDQHSWQEQVVSRHTLIKKTEAKGHDLQPEWWQGFCFVRRSLLRPFVDGVEPPASHDSAGQLRGHASVWLMSSSLPLFYSLMATWSDSIKKQGVGEWAEPTMATGWAEMALVAGPAGALEELDELAWCQCEDDGGRCWAALCANKRSNHASSSFVFG